jgi:hypothetical protein
VPEIIPALRVCLRPGPIATLGDDDDNPTQVDVLGAIPQVSRGSETELDAKIDLTAAGNTVQVADPSSCRKCSAGCSMWAVHRSKKPRYPRYSGRENTTKRVKTYSPQ